MRSTPPQTSRPARGHLVGVVATAAAVLAAVAAPLALNAQSPGASPLGERAATVLDRWGRAYAEGRLLLTDYARRSGETHRLYAPGVLPEPLPLSMTHAAALGHCARLALLDGGRRGEEALLRLAAVRAGTRAARERRTDEEVQELAREAFARHASPAGCAFLLDVAGGDLVVEQASWSRLEDGEAALQAAALRILARTGRAVFRPAVEAGLDHDRAQVRLAAAEALAELPVAAESLPVIAGHLETETNPVVMRRLARTARLLLQRTDGLAPAALEAAFGGTVTALGSGRGDWRSDLELVDLLSMLRTPRAVPALIEVLERPLLADGDSAQRSGGLLRHAAWRLARQLTGANLPADDPAAWRRLWDAESARILDREGRAVRPPPVLSADREGPTRGDAGSGPGGAGAAVESDDAPGPTSARFFGIPVHGRRIVFVLDTSGSMQEPMRGRDASAPGTTRGTRRGARAPDRLEAAREELWGVVSRLPEDAWFDVVPFADRAGVWRGRLTRNTVGTRQALRSWLARLRPFGATNLHAALARALGDGGGDPTDPPETLPEEIFVLSDGQPSAGPLVGREELLAWLGDANARAGVRIHGVYIGDGDSALLRQLAEAHGGRYVRP